MRKFYRLLNYEVSENIIPLILICIGKIVISLISIQIALEKPNNWVKRYEDFYLSSGCIIIFTMALIGIFGLCIKSLYSNYFGSKGIYTLLTLPVKREYIYFSRFCAFLIYFLALFAAEIITAFTGYKLFTSYITRYPWMLQDEGRYLLTNGLFLAFIRSDFFRIILPLGIESLIYSFSILISVVSGLYYAFICERSSRYWGILLIGIALVILIRGIVYPITHTSGLDRYISKYIYSIPLIVFSVIFMLNSIKLLKRGAIT
ncbi:MAG: hypothetical protein GX974_00725 [Clostridiales bacterium]|nr:hypothetical protein [Clostridiales bacterium]